VIGSFFTGGAVAVSPSGIFVLMDAALNELVLFCGFWFLVGAIDDFCVDMIWMVRRMYRHVRYYRRAGSMTVDLLPKPKRHGKLCIFIPTWQEAAVIEQMLARCSAAWRHGPEHIIYVGCYPNDYLGIAAVRRSALANPRIRLIICDVPGPTTKADCLNHLWRAMVSDELRSGYKIKAVILHDAEDMVHAQELLVYDSLIEKNHAVQIPVIPVRVAGSPFISGHYCDEFAESHGKSMVVREALGVPLPLAGVGCAIARNTLGQIAILKNHSPFDASSLTEDYELGLKIGNAGGKTIMVRIFASDGDLIGTRACFPATIGTSVRQKTRWLTGIALAGWDRVGWQGGGAELWMLCRDRKAIFAALVLVLAYVAVVMAAIAAFLHWTGIHTTAPISEAASTLLMINGGFLFWRLLMRAAFVWQLYGPAEAALSIPRVLVSNTVAIMAARRAVFGYLRHCFGAELQWDKTAHPHFPAKKLHE
jgi:adsorption protein B